MSQSFLEKSGVDPRPDFKAEPHNIEAEQALLGAIFINNDAYDHVSGFLEAIHFYDPLHGRIYDAAAKLIVDGKRASPVTLKTFFEHEEPVGQNLTVPQYLGRLAATATTIINAKDYAQTIYDLCLRRSLILIGEDMVNSAYDALINRPPRSIIEQVEQQLFSIVQTGQDRPDILDMGAMLDEGLRSIEGAFRRDGKLAGYSTGFIDLDQKLGGLAPGDLIIVAGRPSMGKTSLVTNIALNISERPPEENGLGGCPVGFFSLEMSALQQAMRLIAEWVQIPSDKLRRGDISQAEFSRIMHMADTKKSVPFYIDQSSTLSVGQLKARARRMKRQKNIGVVIVDYLQLMKEDNRRGGNRVAEITEITRGLKEIAKDLQIPVVALSQLSRNVEQRDPPIPTLADLRESGSIEQDADVVMFIYREEYYIERRQPREGTAQYHEWMAELADAKGKANIIIAKQRQGATGTVTLRFDAKRTRFENLAEARPEMEMFP